MESKVNFVFIYIFYRGEGVEGGLAWLVALENIFPQEE